jgi:F-type H+-transporting ATPase subunit a
MEEASNVLFRIGPLEVTSAVTTMWAIILVLTVLSWLATRSLKEVPGPLQNAAEMAVGYLRSYYEDNLGKENGRKYFSVFATFFVFIIISNYSGILPGAGHLKGFAVPTACLSVTAGLGVIAFFTTHVIGVREKGLGRYLASFASIKPAILVILMLPLHLIEQIIRPVSLALRLYGNMYGEETVTEKLYEIFPIGVPLIMNVLSLLFCALQAMVFTMLLSIYVSEAVEEEE